jgi:hypothetical protein
MPGEPGIAYRQCATLPDAQVAGGGPLQVPAGLTQLLAAAEAIDPAGLRGRRRRNLAEFSDFGVPGTGARLGGTPPSRE